MRKEGKGKLAGEPFPINCGMKNGSLIHKKTNSLHL